MPQNRVTFFIVVSAAVLLVFVTCPTNISAAPQPQYVYNRVDYPTGNGPTSIAVADFNGDGIQDAITANRFDASLSVLLGTTSGLLQAKTDIATPPYPFSLVVGDFNRDGNFDVAVANSSGSVSVLLGNGDGTFATRVDYLVSTAPGTIVSGDFNRDGKGDLAVVASCGQNCGLVAVLLGNGDGTFQNAVNYSVGAQSSDLSVGDFNGDGILDLATATSSNDISVLLGKGDGTFGAAINTSTSGQVSAIVAGDFDHDGTTDVVVCFVSGFSSMAFLKGNGDGTFQAPQELTTNLPTYTVRAADLNGDGKLDLIFTSVFQGGVGVLLGNGDGTFSFEASYTTGAYPVGLVIGDVNGDGNVDLLVANQNASTVTVLLGNGNGTFSPKTDLPSPPGSEFPLRTNAAVAGDFNGDGVVDIALANGSLDYNSTGVVSVLLNQGDGMLAPSIDSNSNGALSVIAAADFNNDGHLDVALSNGNGVAVLLGQGNGSFGSPLQVVFTLGSPARSLAAGDFNGDGNSDLAVIANGFLQTQPIYILLGNGDGTFKAPLRLWNSTTIPDLVRVGDFNHDGKLDLVVTVNPNGIAVALGNGDGTFQNPVTYATDALPSGLTVADVNADGLPDIVAVGNLIDIFLGKGDGTFPTRVTFDGGNFPSQIIAADVNHDGKLDLVAEAQGGGANGAIEILLGNGDGTFLPPVEISSSSFFGPLATADINQDGTPDIITVGLPGSVFLSRPLTSVAPSTLNFGVVGTSSTAPVKQITIVNSGNAPLHISAVAATAGFSATNACGSSVSPSSACTIGVAYTPTGVGISSGYLSISDDAPGHHRSVALSGTSVTPFSMRANSSNISLQPGAHATDVITLTGLRVAEGIPVQFTCAVSGPLPAPACSVSPLSLPTNVDSGTVTLSITAATTTTAFPRKPDMVGQLVSAFCFPLFLAISYFGSSRNRNMRTHDVILCFVFGVFVALSGCGGGGGNSSADTGNIPPPTSYTVTVTGVAGLVQNSLQVTVALNH